MPEEEELEAGHHDIACAKCGKLFAHVTHYGGETLLETCKSCEGMGYECFECTNP